MAWNWIHDQWKFMPLIHMLAFRTSHCRGARRTCLMNARAPTVGDGVLAPADEVGTIWLLVIWGLGFCSSFMKCFDVVFRSGFGGYRHQV